MKKSVKFTVKQINKKYFKTQKNFLFLLKV